MWPKLPPSGGCPLPAKSPCAFLTDFRDEILAVVRQVNIAGMADAHRVRLTAQQTVDELFSLMKPPSVD